jgi:hypothetical protein
MAEFIDTAEQLHALPKGVVLYSCSGMIAARFDEEQGVLFGDNRTVDWSLLPLPAVVIWHPDKPVAQWEPTPDPVLDTFEQLLDLPPGSVILGLAGGVFEKYADTHWYTTARAKQFPLHQVHALLPARLVWHPKWATS